MATRPKKRTSPIDTFRRIALSMPDAEEKSHMDHPDFRANGRIFCTLGFPDTNWGMVALPPDEQKEFVKEYSEVFKPSTGAWGRQGATAVRLDAADEETLGRAITQAWQNAMRKKPGRRRK